MVDSANFIFDRTLGLSLKGKKCLSCDVIVVRFPSQPIFVRQPILLKATENDHSSNACQSFRINVKAVKLAG